MKKVWLVLLSLGLVAVFSASAMAVDVKVSGEFFAAGMYLDKTSLQKNVGPSTAFYFQRLRLQTEFVVSPGLTLTARADVMERAWGAARSASTTVTYNSSTGVVTTSSAALDTLSAGTAAENENIAFDLGYITYISPIGMFTAGYQIDGAWGTVFGDNSIPLGKVGYIIQIGGFYAGIQSGKHNGGEKSYTAINNTNAADRDESFYTVFALYAWKDGQAGVLNKYIRNAGNRYLGIPGSDAGFNTNVDIIIPYMKAKIGPVSVQAELYYMFGKAMSWEGPAPVGTQPDVKVDQLSAWIDATSDFKGFYIGGTIAYVSGDDPGTTDKLEGSNLTGIGLTGGRDWNPCLIMFNNDLTYWAGSQAGYSGTANGGPMTNAYFVQLRGGVRPVDKLDIMASLSWAKADKTPLATWEGREYGYELDLTATYKITTNLSYMLGAGYLFTGKYYKGASDIGTDLENNYMLMNKLSLTF